MPKKNKKFRNLLITIASILILTVLFFFEQPYSVSTWAKVLPQKQWLLIRGRDGALISQIRNNENTMEEEYSVLQISRGEETRYVFNQKLKGERQINLGDTVGTLYSSADEIRYAELQGKLDQARASLNVMQKGEKEEVIKAAEETLNYANAKAQRQKLLLDRLSDLYKNELVPEEEYEQAKAKMNQLNFEVKIAASQLDIVKSGVKTTQLKLAESQIVSLQNEIDVLKKKIKSYTVTSPLTGRISENYGIDTLVTVVDESKFVLLIPVALEDYPYFNDGPVLELSNLNVAFSGESLKTDFGNDVKIINGRQVRIASLVIEGLSEKLLSGMLVPCELKGKNVPLAEYFWKSIN